MVKIILFLLTFFILETRISNAQNKAILLQNVWNNDLNNYNPREYLDQLFIILKNKLSVKDFVFNPKNTITVFKDVNWDKSVKDLINTQRVAQDVYYVATATDLRLPALNLGKLLFKNPPRSSKLTFTFHVFDSTGTEVIGDTIINRGCVINTLPEDKGKTSFYTDYNNFVSDMRCHLEAIKQALQDKPLLKKQRHYADTK